MMRTQEEEDGLSYGSSESEALPDYDVYDYDDDEDEEREKKEEQMAAMDDKIKAQGAKDRKVKAPSSTFFRVVW